MKHYYTEKNYKALLSNMVILVDTRDKTNDSILKWFNDNGIAWKHKALKTGDYSFAIKACPELGFSINTYFTDELCIERKNSIEELAGNISKSEKDDARIFKEFNRMINIDKTFLLIEDNSLDDLMCGNYKTSINSDSLLRTILTWQRRNNMHIYFVKKESMGKMIYELCKNCLDSIILKA